MLSATLFVPVLGAIVIALLPRDNVRMIRQVATVVTAVAFLLSVFVWAGFDPTNPQVQMAQRAVWIPSLNIQYFVGVDGLSLPLVVLTTLLTLMAVLGSMHITLRPKEYFA